ncbi:MAG: ECF RNA polymerase sigma factor SigK [Actinomycetota bacterium]|uniref:ECF RNA polymerase sigma factor SigK n=1 Tax=Paenarthrobacter sp. PH39-S1 TaxID=3046204 RepID=UPI0024BB4D0D|nr:ECF RNA polymerase sigma factor SigK [Paenarthrobacter sp. PH39-S1]MDJ0356482.1 ECF RNA polymerase sigma factor SigK [Paenarthrobacter sp. PH39-S1]MDQ6740231.1 ECF RNA polymerase sigma factor SigK [Actinomycetota bacterium]
MDTPRTARLPDPPRQLQTPDDAGNSERDNLARLISLTATGDQSAFAQLYQLTAKRVYGMARRVLIDANLAEDTTQEVYLQLWQSAAKYDPAAGSPLGWLMTIAHRRAVDKVRSTQSATDREARYGATSHVIEHDDVVDTVNERLDAESVVKCLATLTATQQESVKLAYYGGLTYREVAEKLGAAVPTIKSRIRDGLLRLKTCLEVG